MSVTDGGSFKCYAHDPIYETLDPAQWEEHKRDPHYTESGSGPCAICGNITEYSHKPYAKKAVCDNCKEDLK